MYVYNTCKTAEYTCFAAMVLNWTISEYTTKVLSPRAYVCNLSMNPTTVFRVVKCETTFVLESIDAILGFVS